MQKKKKIHDKRQLTTTTTTITIAGIHNWCGIDCHAEVYCDSPQRTADGHAVDLSRRQ